MKRVRTFIAVETGRAIRDKLMALQEELQEAAPDVKWVEPGNLHVTLLFLGEIDLREIPKVCQVVKQACEKHQGFSLRVEKLGAFPTPRRPRILWAGIGEGAGELIAVHDALETALMELGAYRREARAYTPHITIGRTRGETEEESLAPLLTSKADWIAGECEVRDIRVMSSELMSSGPIYTVLSTAPLKARRTH